MQYHQILTLCCIALVVMRAAAATTTRQRSKSLKNNSNNKETVNHVQNINSSSRSAFEILHAEQYDFDAGCSVENICGINTQDVDCVYITADDDGDTVGYLGLDFGNGAVSIKTALAVGYNKTAGSGKIVIRLDSPNGSPIGDIITGSTGGWQSWVVVETFLKFPVDGGIHDLYLSFQKDCFYYDCDTYPAVVNLDWLMFYAQGV